MSRRILAVIADGHEAAALAGLAALVAVARAEGARVRLACLRPLPPPRVDRHDRIVADVDAEMARITRRAVDRLDAAARVFDGVTIETVVRFGAPAREACIETEVFAPDLVVVFASRAAGWRARLHAWSVRRRLTRAVGVRLLSLEPAQSAPARRRSALAASTT